jgi:hypothetical protein
MHVSENLGRSRMTTVKRGEVVERMKIGVDF